MQQQNYSADQLIKLENEFSKTMCPSASAHAQLAKETGLTEKQIEQWFERSRTVWKFYFRVFLDAQCDIEENENTLQKYNEWFEKRRLEWKLINKNKEPIDAKIVAAIQKIIEDEQNAEESAKDEEWLNERRSQWKWKYMQWFCLFLPNDLQNAKLPPIYDKIFDAVQKAMKEGQNAKAEVKDEEYYKRRAKNNREEAKKRQQKRAQQQNFSADQLDKLEREFEKRNEKMAKEIGLTETQVKMQQEKLTADQLDKFELKFGTTKCPNASDCSQLAIETGLTEKQVEEWFYRRILQGQKIGEALNKIPRQRTEFKHYQLRKLKNVFVLNHFPNIFLINELAKETDLTEEQIEMWFKNAQAKYSRHNNKEHQSLMMLQQNAAVAGAKICVECGQRIVHQTVPQSQQNANAIGVASVDCTSVSAARGRAKCLRLFWRAFTFPVNAVAELVKKMRSAKCALANKVKKRQK